MKGNVIRLNIMHLNSVHLNSIGEVQSVSLTAGESTEDPVYPPTTYTLAANVSNGKVTATKNGTAISLPYVATEGDVIVLSVTPDEGYEFNGWLDGNNSNPRTVTMTGNVVLSASCVEIAKPTYTLSASVTNGMVSATRNGSAVTLPFTANEGDVIVVEVTPNDGYAFEGWNDGNTDNPRTITMTADVALSAQCVEVVQPPVGNYIQFEDKAVEAICVENWSSDGIGLTEEDAAAVTSIGTTFSGNTEITSFEEFRYFTKVTSLDTSAFEGCSSLRSLDATNIKDIGNYALCNLPLQSLNLYYDAVSTIGTDGLRGLSCLPSSLSMPSLTSVGRGNALRSTNIEEVLDFGGVTEISAYTFYECTNLKVVNIPSTCTSIQAQALAYCYALKKVVCRATTPPELHAQTFMSTNSDFIIYVPDGSLEAYKTATNWNQYADRIHPLSEIEDYYVSDALLMHLDGINKGNVEGEWQDLVSGNTFVNHGAVAEADGWRFDGASSYMDSATLGTIGWWNKARTLEVVVKFDDISENRTEVVFLGRKNCMAFGRYKSEHFVNSAGLSVPSIKIQSDNGKVIYGYCGNSTSYVRSIINGQQGATSYGNSFSGFLETTAYLGKKISNDDYFKGKIHAIRIHDRILSEEEILYNQRIDNKRFNLGLDI